MTEPTAAPRRRRAASVPGAVFTVLAGAILVLVATALNPAQPPPPAVAEYAPAAVRAITEAPPEQVSESGDARGANGQQGGDTGTGPGTPTPTVTPSAGGLPSPDPSTVIEKERVSKCVGNPPRQTEDPQSPPCVPYWEGDNGGATSRGVSRNEIRISMPSRTDQHLDLLVRYFNTRYQFYGRQIKIVRDESCFGGDPAGMKKTAADIEALKVFGVAGFCDVGGIERYFYDELAKRRIVGTYQMPPGMTEAQLAANHPYSWTFLPTFDKGARHLAELACTLAGKPAAHGGPDVVASQRKFGLWLNNFTDAPSPDASAAKAALSACGITPVTAEVQFERDTAGGQGVSQATAQQVSNGVVRMRQEGVTTMLMLAHSNTTKQIMTTLDSQGYQPELLASTYFYNDEDMFIQQQPRTQTAHLFGITTQNKVAAVEDMPWHAAVKEMDPSWQPDYPPFTYLGIRNDYQALLMMAAGLQMAGPNLTPETFARGLQTAAWPNPPTELWPGKVTVSVGTHSYMEDAAVIWWDNAGKSTYTSQAGAWCYSENGKRRRLGGYPADNQIQRPPCQRFRTS